MTLSSGCASVDEGGQALESEGGGGHGRYPRSGNGRSGLLRRLARRGDGSASPRRGRGSALARGIQRDGQFPRCGRHSPENVEFWAGKPERRR